MSKIMDGLKLQGQPAEIPDCIRTDLPQFFVEMGFKAGVEIGVYKAGYTEYFCKAGLKIYAVDPWLIYPHYYAVGGQNRQELIYEGAKKTLAPYDCTIIRKTSMDALVDIPDESLDFVYIDGNHDFRYVAEDIYEWSKKVRGGGVVSGHDYFFASEANGRTSGVPYVVSAYTQAYGIKNWYVLGRAHRKHRGERKDMWRSWMWIKE